MCFVSAACRLPDVNSTSGRMVFGIYTHIYIYVYMYVECVYVQVVVAKHDGSDVTVPSWKLLSIHGCRCVLPSVHVLQGWRRRVQKELVFFEASTSGRRSPWMLFRVSSLLTCIYLLETFFDSADFPNTHHAPWKLQSSHACLCVLPSVLVFPSLAQDSTKGASDILKHRQAAVEARGCFSDVCVNEVAKCQWD